GGARRGLRALRVGAPGERGGARGAPPQRSLPAVRGGGGGEACAPAEAHVLLALGASGGGRRRSLDRRNAVGAPPGRNRDCTQQGCSFGAPVPPGWQRRARAGGGRARRRGGQAGARAAAGETK